jgi:L-galactose dehydrogenase
MQYRPLGTTGLQVSVLGYGASPLGGVFYAIDEAEGIRTVRTALDLGVNIVDVSPYYGSTVAESVLGRALRGMDRSSYVLATKVGRYGSDSFDFSAQRVRRSVDESLGGLGVEHIDLIQCHDIEFGDLDQIVNETIPALETLRDKGKVRFIGVTGYPVNELWGVASRVPVDTVLSYCRYTLADQALLEYIPRFEGHGVGIINASPLSMGLLTEAGLPRWHPASADLRAAAQRAAALCRDHKVEIAKLALQFAVAHESFATTLVGTADPANMARNVAWIREPFDAGLAAEVAAVFDGVTRDWPSGRAVNPSTARR